MRIITLIMLVTLVSFGTSCNSKKKAQEVARQEAAREADQKMADRNERIRRDGRTGRNDRYSNNGQNGRPGTVGGRGGMSEQGKQRMYDQLELSKDQIAKYELIAQKYGQMRNESREAGGNNREGMREQMQEIKRRMQTELKSVFTAQQFEKYVEMMDRRRGPGQQGRMRRD